MGKSRKGKQFDICRRLRLKGKKNGKQKKGERWAFSPDLTRGMIPLDPHKQKLLGSTKKQAPAADWKVTRLGAVMASGPDEPPMTACGGNFIGGEIRRNEQCPLCGLATIEPAERAAIPDAKHPGKARENPRGRASFPPGIFSCFLGPEAH